MLLGTGSAACAGWMFMAAIVANVTVNTARRPSSPCRFRDFPYSDNVMSVHPWAGGDRRSLQAAGMSGDRCVNTQ